MAEQSDKTDRLVRTRAVRRERQEDRHDHRTGLSAQEVRHRWLLVETADARKLPVPLIGIRSSGDRLVLPYPKSYIESGPTIVHDQPLSQAEERRLGLHYGFDNYLPGASCCQACGLCYAHKRQEHAG